MVSRIFRINFTRGVFISKACGKVHHKAEFE